MVVKELSQIEIYKAFEEMRTQAYWEDSIRDDEGEHSEATTKIHNFAKDFGISNETITVLQLLARQILIQESLEG